MSQNTKERIYQVVTNTILQFNEEIENKIDLKNGNATRLFGGDAGLDSIDLVSLVVSIEEAIEDEFGISIVLADEKAMSRRVSPFASVGLLVEYIEELCAMQKDDTKT
jgi:acyl carrier protein